MSFLQNRTPFLLKFNLRFAKKAYLFNIKNIKIDYIFQRLEVQNDRDKRIHIYCTKHVQSKDVF